MTCSRREELFGLRRFSLFGRMELRESVIIRIRTEVVCSWFGCKEKDRLFTYSGDDYE